MSKIDDPRDVLLKPMISEKSYRLLDDGKYTFLVATEAAEDGDEAAAKPKASRARKPAPAKDEAEAKEEQE